MDVTVHTEQGQTWRTVRAIRRSVSSWRVWWLLAVCLLYLALSTFQLGLPGLHYDEAKEAGVNAVELLTGQPVSAFRGASVEFFGHKLPLMVQDYIGAIDVYLALPFLAISGIGVPNLRALSVLIGLVTLLVIERAVSEWIATGRGWYPISRSERSTLAVSQPRFGVPISLAGLMAITLLAASPSFVFWSRQGIFVTNLTQPLCFWSMWMAMRWLRTGRQRALIVSAFAAGLALYAKLLAVWLLVPFALLASLWWVVQRVQGGYIPSLPLRTAVAALGAFLLPLLPMVFFNVQTAGTISSITGNLQQSYYGVDNRAVAGNLAIRVRQLQEILQGTQFWYLGGSYGNRLAPLLAAVAVLAGVWRCWRSVLPPLLLLLCAVGMSIFTVSDLFITHYALLHPLVAAVVGVALASWFLPWTDSSSQALTHAPRAAITGVVVVSLLMAVWVAEDSYASVRYHRALAESGGLADHADTSYRLVYHLRHSGFDAPIALDWGMDAPARFLSEGTVRPIEVFGYTSLSEPDTDYLRRLDLFLGNPDNVYLLHDPDHTVFAGRREVFMTTAAEKGLTPVMEAQFFQRDGTPIYEIWRVK